MGATLTRAQPGFRAESAVAALRAEGLQPRAWSNGAGDVYAPHRHAYDKVLYCLRGSITFRMTEERRDIEVHAGDRLEIDAGTEHAATVGPHGVECVEAAR